jgi:hypothetical protein
MEIRTIFPAITDGGVRVHYECRDCGENLSAEADHCPECNGDPARYEL